MSEKTDKHLEKKLLENQDIDALLEQKLTSRIECEIKDSRKKSSKTLITDITKVPSHKIFSTETTFLVFNRTTKRESFINGKGADSLIGLNKEIRESLIKGIKDNFTVDNYYVKFNCHKVFG